MRIEHVALYVKDLEKAKDFFVTFLKGKANKGYHNPNTNFRSYFISFDDGARLEIMTRPEIIEQQKHPYRSGYAHLTFSVGSKKAVDELTARLDEAGYSISSGPRTTGDGYYESCIVGLEDNLIEITV